MNRWTGLLAICALLLPLGSQGQVMPSPGERVRISLREGTVLTGNVTSFSDDEVRLLRKESII